MTLLEFMAASNAFGHGMGERKIKKILETHPDIIYLYIETDKNKLIELGGFNELYAPFYVEDYDLSLRAWRLGYKCYYEHFALCRHQVSK